MDDLFNGPDWKIVEHFGHLHIWDIPEANANDVTVVQDTKSTNVYLVVELPKIDMLTWNRHNVSSNIVTSNVESILKNATRTEDDDFDMVGEEDKTLEDYVEEDIVESDEDDDINEGGDIQEISSDDK